MDERLDAAAKSGDIDTLYALLSIDPLILENSNAFPFSQTPLHVAALAGETSFLLELSNLKPSLLRKLNTDGYSPIHIASIEGQVEMVKELLDFDPELGLLKGREWRTPLHCAVINGKLEVVNELLSDCSLDWLKALTVRKETVLHLALKHDHIQVFEMLLERVKSSNVQEILNWKDREGNTVLHLATDRKYFKIVETLLRINDFRKVVDVNMKNTSGMTAIDILRQHEMNESSNVEIENRLRFVGAVAGQDIITLAPVQISSKTNSNEAFVIMESLFRRLPMDEWAKEIENSPSETRSALMVISVLIATVTFQAVLSPPGGFNDLDLPTIWPLNEATSMAADNPIFFVLFSVMNIVGFVTSLVMITVLTRRFPLKALLRLAVLSMASTYLCSIIYVVMSNKTIVAVLAILMFLVLLVQWFHLKYRSLKKGKKSV